MIAYERLVLLLAAFAVFFIMLASEKPEPQHQKCLRCGNDVVFTPNDSSIRVSPTTEWCFMDGSYCNEGFQLILMADKWGKTKFLEKKWLEHCKACNGCKYGSFTPETWKLALESK